MGRHELGDLYYLTLLRMVGCTVDAGGTRRTSATRWRSPRDTQHLDYRDPEAFGRWVMESFAVDQPPDVRRQMIDKLSTYTPEKRRRNLLGHCEVARMLATRLGMPGGVADGLGYVFERWDGTGVPNGIPATPSLSACGS